MIHRKTNMKRSLAASQKRSTVMRLLANLLEVKSTNIPRRTNLTFSILRESSTILMKILLPLLKKSKSSCKSKDLNGTFSMFILLHIKVVELGLTLLFQLTIKLFKLMSSWKPLDLNSETTLFMVAYVMSRTQELSLFQSSEKILMKKILRNSWMSWLLNQSKQILW